MTREANRLCPTGFITVANAAALAESGKREFGSGDLVVDLAGVTEVDSAALSLLLEWRREAQRRGIRLTFQNLPASLNSLAALYGVSDFIAANA